MFRYFKTITAITLFHHKNLKDCLMKILHSLLTLGLSFYGTKSRATFTGSCLKQEKIT